MWWFFLCVVTPPVRPSSYPHPHHYQDQNFLFILEWEHTRYTTQKQNSQQKKIHISFCTKNFKKTRKLIISTWAPSLFFRLVLFFQFFFQVFLLLLLLVERKSLIFNYNERGKNPKNPHLLIIIAEIFVCVVCYIINVTIFLCCLLQSLSRFAKLFFVC